MGHIIIAPVGDNIKALFIGMKEFPTEKVILITPRSNARKARDVQEKLKEFTILSEITLIDDKNVMEEIFRVFGELCNLYDNDNIIVNVATGDRITTCAALSASFANGLKAFGISDGRVMLLPIMRLSYYNELSENKMRILESLPKEGYINLSELSKKLKISLSLLSYHINGNYKYKGLREYRLVDVMEKNKNLLVRLSDMGKLLLKGYIKKDNK